MNRFLVYIVLAAVITLGGCITGWVTQNLAWALLSLPSIFLIGMWIGIDAYHEKVLGGNPEGMEMAEVYRRIFG